MSRDPWMRAARTGAALAAYALLAAGCAASTPSAAPAASAPEPQAAAPDRWRRAAFPVEGITIEMPGEAEEARTTWRLEDKALVDLHGLQLLDHGEGTPDYGVFRLRPTEGWPSTISDPDVLLRMVRLTLEEVRAESPVTHQGFHGQALEAQSQEGKQVLARAFAVGGCAYLLTVDAAPGRVDRGEAERFFASFQLQMPWRVFAWPEGRVTAAVPAVAAVTAQSVPIEGSPFPLHMHLFTLGGEQDATYAVMFAELPRERLEQTTTEQILDEGAKLEQAGRGDHRAAEIHHPRRYPGAGHDQPAPKRVLLAYPAVRLGGRMYMAMLVTKSLEALEDEQAARFFASVQLGRAP